MVVAKNQFYFSMATGTYGIISTSFTSATIVYGFGTSGTYGPGNYRGMCYDPVNNNIVAANYASSSVEILSIKLAFISTVALPTNPHGVMSYNSKIYVCYWTNGHIAVISNGVITNTFATLCSSAIPTLGVDPYGNILIPCYPTGITYLYDSTVTYINKFLTVSGNVLFGFIDSKDHLALASYSTVYLFY